MDFNRTNTKASLKKEEIIAQSQDLQDMIACGWYTIEELKSKRFQNIYEYYDSYLDIQNQLITLLIGEPELDNDDMAWLNDIA